MSSEMDKSSSEVDVALNEEDYIRYLESKVRLLEAEREKLLMKLNYYKSELEKMISPPLIEGIV